MFCNIKNLTLNNILFYFLLILIILAGGILFKKYIINIENFLGGSSDSSDDNVEKECDEGDQSCKLENFITKANKYIAEEAVKDGKYNEVKLKEKEELIKKSYMLAKKIKRFNLLSKFNPSETMADIQIIDRGGTNADKSYEKLKQYYDIINSGGGIGSIGGEGAIGGIGSSASSSVFG